MYQRKENNKRVFKCIYQSSLSNLASYLPLPYQKQSQTHAYLISAGNLTGVKNDKKPSSGGPKGGRGRLNRVAS